MPKQPAKKELLKTILLPIIILLLLALATFNLQSYLEKDDGSFVLGKSTSLEEESAFWENFLEENPNYLPGWIEYAKIKKEQGDSKELESALDRVEKLDPNHQLNLED